jgi:hypothetical protein
MANRREEEEGGSDGHRDGAGGAHGVRPREYVRIVMRRRRWIVPRLAS